MGSPTTAPLLRDLPISFNTRWSVDNVRATLVDLMNGDFNRPAMLAEAMLGDDRILHCYQQVCLEVTGRDLVMQPNDDADKRMSRSWARDVQSWYGEALSIDAAWELVKWTEFLGVAVGQLSAVPVIGEKREWRPKVKILPPHWLRRTLDPVNGVEWKYMTRDGWQVVTPGKNGWLLWMPRGERGHVEGSIRALAHPWQARVFARKDFSRWSELFGNGLIKAKHPKDAKDPTVRRWLDGLRNLGREPVVKVPEGYDVELVNATNAQADGFEKLLAHCDAAITLVWQGQTLTSGTAPNGNRSLGDQHRATANLRNVGRVKALQVFERDQVLKPATRWNQGESLEELAPFPSRDLDAPEDVKTASEAIGSFCDALAKAVKLGLPVDVEELCERFNIPIDADKLDRLVSLEGEGLKALTVNEIRELMGYEDLKEGGDALFGATSAPSSPSDPNAPPPAGEPPPENPPPPVDPGGEPEPTKATDPAAKPSSKPKRDFKPGNIVKAAARAKEKGTAAGDDFTDRLVADGARDFEDAIESDVDTILDLIEKASSFDDLKKKTTRAHARMKPKKAAATLAKSSTLARLGGRRAIREDVEG